MSDDEYGEATSGNGSGIGPKWGAVWCGIAFIAIFFVSSSLWALLGAAVSFAVAAFAAYTNV